MATGTGKNTQHFKLFIDFGKVKQKEILFLADRTALIDQTARGDFGHFKDALTIIKIKKLIKLIMFI